MKGDQKNGLQKASGKGSVSADGQLGLVEQGRVQERLEKIQVQHG
jgi:hypothetical protein